MERTQHTEGEEAMYKRILRKRIVKGLVLSLTVLAAIPVTSAAAKPVSVGQPDPWFQSLMANRSYQKSLVGVTGQELKAMTVRGQALTRKYHLGQYAFGPTQAELRAMIARGEGMNEKYNLGQYAFGPTQAELRAMIARGEGMNEKYNLGQFAVTSESSQKPVASGSDNFEWRSIGLGIGIAALLVAGVSAALVVRTRHQGTLAH
jgi:hypothetical protein